MEQKAVFDPDMRTLSELESKNFEVNVARLGKTAELVEDFQNLYGTLTRLVVVPDGGAETDAAKAVMVAIHMAMKARGDLLQGAVNLLRGYRGNSLRFLRGAIEASAFAAKVKRYPERADFWLRANDSEKAYEQYRKKFEKLFPADDPLLQLLYGKYDFCSRTLHSSLFSVCGHASYVGDEQGWGIRFNVFDLPDDNSIGPSLYFTLDTHKLILKKFAEVLTENVGDDLKTWTIRFNSVEAKLDYHREHWKALVPNPLTATP